MGIFKFASGALLAAGILLVVAEPAAAQPFAFGGSYYDGNETLQLTTTRGTVVLNTGGDQGWWSATYPNIAGNNNYFTGDPGGGVELNDFFMFPLASLAGATVTGATLSVTEFNVTAPLTLRLGDASALANAGVLLPTNGTSAAIYNALGVGGFGNFALTPGDSLSQLNFTLNSSAITAINHDINAGDQFFAIGGSVASVPEPATWAMLILGMGVLGVAIRRRTGALVAA